MRLVKGIVSGAIATAFVMAAPATGFAADKSSSYPEPVWPKYTKNVSITWWMWTTDTAQLIKAFNKVYPNIHVVQRNVANEYTKLATVLKAGSGAPDVVQVEYQMLPQFINTGGLTDISQYVSRFQSRYPQWVWNQVSSGGKVYAVPEDIAPMGLIYRKDVFDKYHLPVPTTWAQFAADAAKLHQANPKQYLTYFTPTDGGRIMGLLWQAGARPFQQTSSGWKINFTSPEAKKVMNFWGDLIKKGYVKSTTDWTPQWGAELGKGVYAADVGAAWSPDYELAPYIKNGAQQWQAATIPQWDLSHPSDGNWGGSTIAVTTQSKNPEAAALFAAWVNMSQQGIAIGNNVGGYFTADVNSAKVPEFSAPIKFLGNQRANLVFNKEVNWVDTSFQWSPWTTYVYNEMGVEFTKAAAGRESWNQALANIQQNVTQFARTQGYTVVN